MKFLRIASPVLLGLYSPISLAARNVGQMPLADAYRSIIAVGGISFALLAICWLVTRHLDSAVVIASIAIVLFFSYGHMYALLKDSASEYARHRYLLPLWGLAFTAAIWLSVRKPTALKGFSNGFLIVGMAAVFMPTYELVSYQISRPERLGDAASGLASSLSNRVASGEGIRPDVFYIVLDGYGREDILRDLYDIDNSSFIRYLEDQEFYVARDSWSNYTQTSLSFAATLNTAYVDNLMITLDPGSRDLRPLAELIMHSQVRQIFDDLGYVFVAFDTGLPYTSINDAQVYLYPDFEKLDQRQAVLAGLSLNAFEGLLIETTAARIFLDRRIQQAGIGLAGLDTELPFEQHRTRVLFTLSSLSQFARREGDHFVFAHIISPHPPFVFGPAGEHVQHAGLFSFQDNGCCRTSEYIAGYRDQLSFLNNLLQLEINDILSSSDTPPIIILQADHGPGAYLTSSHETSNLAERFGILHALLVPGFDSGQLYPSISPVNSFRLVLGQILGEKIDLLPDKSYFAPGGYPYDLVEVTHLLEASK